MAPVQAPHPSSAAVRAHVADVLHRAGVRLSEPRRAVIDALLACPDHVSSEELALRLRGQSPRVSLSTVYRCLRVLVAHGLAREIRVGDTSRFEMTVGREQHDHLVCRRCERIVEFEGERFRELARGIARESGFASAALRIEVFSLCETCASSEAPAP